MFDMYRTILKLETEHHTQLTDITDLVLEEIKKSGKENGQVLVQAMHTTTGIMVNEYEFKIELQSKRKGFRYFNSLFVVKYNHNSVSVNDKIGSIKKRTDKSPVINQDVALIKKKLLKLVKNVEIRTK